MATSFGRYDNHKASAIQDLKDWLHVVLKNVKFYVNINIC